MQGEKKKFKSLEGEQVKRILTAEKSLDYNSSS